MAAREDGAFRLSLIVQGLARDCEASVKCREGRIVMAK